MLRTILTSLLLSAMLMASQNYTVRLAVFKNAYKLHKIINKYPPAIRKTVKTYKYNHKTYAYTIPTTNRAILKKLLPAYRRIFKDAYLQPTKRKF